MSRLRMVLHLLRKNGVQWLLLYFLERSLGWSTTSFRRVRIDLEIKKKLPGFNTVRYNYQAWSRYNWTGKGEEWTDSEAWKRSLLEETVFKYFLSQKCILEIGPGAGRWSTTLVEISRKLILVDITEVSLDLCREKLSGHPHCQYYRNNGTDLSFLGDATVDYVWSFDVFVHIAPDDAAQYIRELGRVLVKNGIGIIHHPATGGYKGGFRSSVTNEFFCNALTLHGFEIIRQLRHWGKDGVFSLEAFDDRVTIFRKL